MTKHASWKLPVPGSIRFWLVPIIWAVVVVACLYNVFGVARRAVELNFWETNIDSVDEMYADMRTTLISMGAPGTIGYILDGPLTELPAEIQGRYVLAQYGLAPFKIRGAIPEDPFVILDAHARVKPDVPENLVLVKSYGSAVFLLRRQGK